MKKQLYLSPTSVLEELGSKIACILITLQLALLSLGVARAATPIMGSISDVTIALTLGWTKENAIKTLGTSQIRSGASVAASLGNKDFLQYMKENGLLTDTSITGWKIVYISSGEVTGLFASKLAKTPVKVPEDVLSLITPSAWSNEVYGEAESYSETSKSDQFISSSTAGRYVGGITGTLPAGIFKGLQFKAVGISSSSSSSIAGKVPEASLKYWNLMSLTGATSTGGSMEPWTRPIIEGRVSVGQGVPANVSSFFGVNK